MGGKPVTCVEDNYTVGPGLCPAEDLLRQCRTDHRGPGGGVHFWGQRKPQAEVQEAASLSWDCRLAGRRDVDDH